MSDSDALLWDGNEVENVRSPKMTPHHVLKNESSQSKPDTTQEAVDNTAPTTHKLRAEADEWYPPGYKTTVKPTYVPRKSAQDRLNKIKLQQTDNVDENNVQNGFSHSTDYVRIQHLITTLSRDPGQFHALQEIFIETLVPYFEDLNALSRVIDLLLEEATKNSSFRYTSARLCECIEEQSPFFRAQLSLLCEKECNRTKNLIGFTFFIAELYMQFQPDNIYSKLLFNLFHRLIDSGQKDEIKTVCQALKLTGYSLDFCNKEEMNKIFTKLEHKARTRSGIVVDLISSILHLRMDEMWGHKNTATSSNPSNMVNNTSTENTKIYTSGDMELSAEEQEFLAAHMPPDADNFSDSSGEIDEYSDPEMNDEIQAAYVEFLNSTTS